MNLDDKINAPIPTAADPLAEALAYTKRRKGDNSGTLAIPKKAKKAEKTPARRQPKKALVFDAPADNGPGLANLVSIKSDTAMARVLATPANDAPVVQPALVEAVDIAAELVPTVAAPPASQELEPTMAAPQAPESAPAPVAEEPAVADAKSSVFMVATLQINEPASAAPSAPAEQPEAEPAAANDLRLAELASSVAAPIEPAAAIETSEPAAVEEPGVVVAEPVSATNEIAAVEEPVESTPTVAEPAAAPVETAPVQTTVDSIAASAPEVVSEPVAPAPVEEPSVAAAPVEEPKPAPAQRITVTVNPPRRLAIPPAEEVVEEPKPVPVAAEPAKPETDAGTNAPVRLSRSEAIARAARAKALSGAKAAPSPEALLQAARAEAEQRRAAEQAKQPTDLYGYWTRAKNGRRFPARADFDAEQVAENWPNSMLLTCGSMSGNGNINITQVLRLGASRRSRPTEELNFTSMITEWMLAIGGEAAKAGQPVQDSETFRTPEGTHAYKIVALPLSDQQTRVDHVLCHLTRA